MIALTADEVFAAALGGQRLMLDGATGNLKPPSVMQRLTSALRIANRE